MSTRLGRAIRELNIGLQTAVEFLEKKSDLGEVKNDLNFKINEKQHAALIEEFKQDKEQKSQAEKVFSKRPKEKKTIRVEQPDKAEAVLPENKRQQFKQVGKIDLDALNKKPTVPKTAEKESVVEDKVTNTVENPVGTASKKVADIADVQVETQPAEATRVDM